MVSMAETLNAAVKENGPVTNRDVVNWVRRTHAFFNPVNAIGACSLYKNLAKSNDNDKYKHAMMNCKMYQGGFTNSAIIDALARLKEQNDLNSKSNTLEESNDDMLANTLGAYLGLKYPNGDCDEMVQKYISKSYKK